MNNILPTTEMIATFNNGCDKSDANYHEESLFLYRDQYCVLVKRGATTFCYDCNEEHIFGVSDFVPYTEIDALNWLINNNFVDKALELFDEDICKHHKEFLSTKTIFKIKTYDYLGEFYAFMQQEPIKMNGFLYLRVLGLDLSDKSQLKVKDWTNIGIALSNIKSIKPAGKLNLHENTITGIARNQAVSGNRVFDFFENQMS